eukprot:TRINITY_DN3914_c0_g1_i1.p1 TRINITY_DN3914_c0_g1~~TRINITY_DN3914_c0_g1_i1.p1  ORF type:complete len:176 (+),score=35.52 TRINITY_DN3914_c0_g1_i1:3-530(+)
MRITPLLLWICFAMAASLTSLPTLESLKTLRTLESATNPNQNPGVADGGPGDLRGLRAVAAQHQEAAKSAFQSYVSSSDVADANTALAESEAVIHLSGRHQGLSFMAQDSLTTIHLVEAIFAHRQLQADDFARVRLQRASQDINDQGEEGYPPEKITPRRYNKQICQEWSNMLLK